MDVKSPKKEAFKVEGQSPSKESKMNEEEVDLEDETPLLEIRQSPSKVKISTIEAETNDQETTNNDEITEEIGRAHV